MRLLITGGSSYLGRHLVPLAAQDSSVNFFAYTYYSANPLGLPQAVPLDVRDSAAVDSCFAQTRPDVVIHTVGSNRPADMAAVITRGTEYVCQAAVACGARLIHVSTDAIFDGRSAPYDENAIPAPVNAYGAAKLEAERFIQENYANAAIVRTSLIYGTTIMDNGTAWMATALRAGQPVTLFTNQIRNPVWAETLSRALLELAGSTFTGVINVAGRQVMSRAEFALRMLDWWQVEDRATLQLGEADGDRWPLDCTLDLSLAERLLATPLPGVDEVLGG